MIDTLAGTWSCLGFAEIQARQKEVLGAIQGARTRVPGTEEEKALTQLLQGYGLFDQPVEAEVRTPGKTKELLGRACVRKDLYVDKAIRRLSVYVDPTLDSKGYFQTLSRAGMFSGEEDLALQKMGGLPMEGVLRYVSFLDRVRARIRVLSVTPGECKAEIFSPPSTGTQVPLARFDKPVSRTMSGPDQSSACSLWRSAYLSRLAWSASE